MKSYKEIKEEELKRTSGYSYEQLEKYLNFNIKALKAMSFFLRIGVLWTISIVTFFVIPGIFTWLGFCDYDINLVLFITISHFLFWILKGKKDALQLIDDTLPELNLTVKVLEDIKEEKNG